ncbi:HECT-like ubiquitin-conjugating enzyme (E2)-binding protein [Thalictrum thalictroides]|uniref:HECT-like ubiquitin-conjugating enzyme (E2)-binding protein n=1 Tax=Thalictrum thalictroides TaxID=46969 RepID=A0A7J6VEG8_THATH|nr:HECT-like ubiquitin-conjugating enzyme (E2)-binding protein [Thalictrum thalictroides]
MQNPRTWRYTWETLTHIPILRLFLFNSKIKPLNQCKNLKVTLNFEESMLLVSWNEEIENKKDFFIDFIVRVPVPRVLVDLSSPVDFKLMEDYIEVKLVLLLPVDNPILINFDSIVNISGEETNSKMPQSLSVASDLKCLLSQDEVNFFCKKCSTKLTKRPLRSFVELPSADWREVADNWFGACCCSFGGISEKLVKQYANSYLYSEGSCLLDASSVVISSEELTEHVFPNSIDRSKADSLVCDLVDENNKTKPVVASRCNGTQRLSSENLYESASPNNKSIACSQVLNSACRAGEKFSFTLLKKERITSNLENERENYVDTAPSISSALSDFSGSTTSAHKDFASGSDHCCADITNNVPNHGSEVCTHDISAISSKDQIVTDCINPLRNQKALLNISLGNGFMVRNSNLSRDVDWNELRCPQCSSVLGAYPTTNEIHASADGGVRLFKCCTSTGLPVGASNDIFRNHTLHRVFVHQLMESADDELSFRTVLRDLSTRLPLLQIVLLNTDAWRCTGCCVDIEDNVRPFPKTELRRVVKVLFSDCSNNTEVQSRILEEWATKNQADEVFMFRHQVKELIESLNSAMDSFPSSCSSMQGLSLSFIEW